MDFKSFVRCENLVLRSGKYLLFREILLFDLMSYLIVFSDFLIFVIFCIIVFELYSLILILVLINVLIIFKCFIL